MDQTIARYAELRVPRYTSYPPAPRFGPEVDGTRYGGWLAELAPDTVVGLYLHVPFCRQVCWYCACNMKLAAREAPVRAYAALLRREIA
ncbi:MAG: coproporphyrinogen III oxidase, partial [Geminicoccaceae bacterium]